MGAAITNNMKNKLNKIITTSLLAILLAGGLASAQTATNTPEVTQSNDSVVSNWDGGNVGYGMMNDGNWNNYRGNHMYNQKGWESMVPGFAAGFVGLGVFVGIIGVILVAFWIWMLVHATTSDIKFKPLWLLVLWFMHVVGAIIYFFAVKRRYDLETQECGCESCSADSHKNTCACGKNETCKCHEHEKAHQEHHLE